MCISVKHGLEPPTFLVRWSLHFTEGENRDLSDPRIVTVAKMSLSWRICGLSIFITIILDNSLTLSNVGELSWSWIPRRTISNFRKGKKILSYWVVACFHVSSIRCDIRPFAHYGHEGWALSGQNKVMALIT